MSPSGVTERVRRLEQAGIIRGYSGGGRGLPRVHDHGAVRLRYPTATTSRSMSCWPVPRGSSRASLTGEDCFVLNVLARSIVTWRRRPGDQRARP